MTLTIVFLLVAFVAIFGVSCFMAGAKWFNDRYDEQADPKAFRRFQP